MWRLSESNMTITAFIGAWAPDEDRVRRAAGDSCGSGGGGLGGFGVVVLGLADLFGPLAVAPIPIRILLVFGHRVQPSQQRFRSAAFHLHAVKGRHNRSP